MEFVNSEGIYRFYLFIVVDGGEVILILDVSSNFLILDIDDVLIQGGGIFYMVCMRIVVGNFIVDDLGYV